MYIEVTQTISNIIEKQISKTTIEVKPFDTGVGKIAESILQSPGDLIVKYKSGAIGRLARGATGLFLRANAALEEQYEFAQLIGLSAITLANKDSVAANQGDVVVLNNAIDSSFKKSTIEAEPNILGVVYDTSILVDVIGTIQYAGVALVNVTGNVARGDYLVSSATKGLAMSAGQSMPASGVVGIAITAYTGGATGQVSAILNIQDDGKDAWIAAPDTWTYASANSFTIPGDKTAFFEFGNPIRVVQGGVTKFFNVIGKSYTAPNTTITVIGGTEFSLANAAILSPCISRIFNPVGFPKNFTAAGATWSTSGTAFTNVPTGWAKYRMIGRDTYLEIGYSTAAVSGGTGIFRLTFPAGSIPPPAGYHSGVAYCPSNNNLGFCWMGADRVLNMSKYDGTALAGNSSYITFELRFYI